MDERAGLHNSEHCDGGGGDREEGGGGDLPGHLLVKGRMTGDGRTGGGRSVGREGGRRESGSWGE
jgi:hypothetical protein